MTKAANSTANRDSVGAWDQFWFTPGELSQAAKIRGVLCVLTAIYFLSCWSDAAFWYTDGGPLSPERVTAFLQTSGLGSAARWVISPLFMTGSVWVYHGYLVLGILTCLLVVTGRGGRIPAWVLWLLVVGWGNRSMLLSSLTESALSLGLFAVAIAPASSLVTRAGATERKHWTAGFSMRLVSVQATVIGAATFVTMLGGRVWFNGLGAYALAASAEDRTIDWTRYALFRNPLVHESLTHLLVLILPIGLTLVWLRKSHALGKTLLVAWCVVAGALHSDWLYAATLATMFCAIDRRGG